MQGETKKMNRPGDSLGGLLERCAQRDAAALQALYERASPQLFAILLRILKRNEIAEEALQDVFLSVWRRAASYDAGKGPALAWLVTIARYRALDLIRSGAAALAQASPAIDEPTEPEAGPPEQADLAEHAQRLEDCMSRLSPDQRQCIRLAYFDGLAHSEIASSVSSPIGTIKSWIRRGLTVLRECLAE
jgi:RNA polymerase sigma-70 factor (ECF subfamily)